LEGAEALAGGRLHDGTLDLLRGELLNEATAELEEAARATAEAGPCAYTTSHFLVHLNVSCCVPETTGSDAPHYLETYASSSFSCSSAVLSLSLKSLAIITLTTSRRSS
jgi:hypothetical protein